MEAPFGKPFKTGNRAEKIFESWIPADWLCRKQSPDFCVDYVVEVVENGHPTGRQIGVQVKGTEVGPSSRSPLKFRAEGKDMRYWIEKCQFPVFFFLIDTGKESGHWLFIQKFAKDQVSKTALADQKIITLRFEQANNLGDKPRFIESLREAEQYVRDLHPGSIQAALATRRRILEEIEPRFSYAVTAAEGQETVVLSAREIFQIDMHFAREYAETARRELTLAVESGVEVKIPLSHIKFTGSPLFEQLTGGKGELVLDFGKDVPGAMVFKTGANETQRFLQVDGVYRKGSKRARFKGQMRNAPWVVECDLDFTSGLQGIVSDLKLSFPINLWQGQTILSLSYFDAIYSSVRELASAPGLATEWVIDGNCLARTKLFHAQSDDVKRFLNLLSWLDRCRFVSRHFNINPSLPQLDALTLEQMEGADDLAALISGQKRISAWPGFSARVSLSNCPMGTEQSSIRGCVCFNQAKAGFNLLGENIDFGPVSTIFTNVTLTPQPGTPNEPRTLKIQGDDSTMRIIEPAKPLGPPL